MKLPIIFFFLLWSFPLLALDLTSRYFQTIILNNPRQGLLSPEKIEILADGKPLKTIASNKIKIVGNTASCDIDIDFSKMKNVVIKMTPKEAKKSIIACDEVQILKL